MMYKEALDKAYEELNICINRNEFEKAFKKGFLYASNGKI